MPGWNRLRTHDDWAGKLDELLAAALDALAGNGSLGTAKRNLMTFIDKSPNRVAADLDDVADEARRALSKAQIDGSIDSLRERTDDLKVLRKQIAGITEEANEAASAIRLEKARAVVTATTSALAEMRALKEFVESEGLDPELVDRIDETIASVRELRDTLEEG